MGRHGGAASEVADYTQEAWIQVVGRVAIHPVNQAPIELTGSTRILLAMLVASGQDGASIDAIAEVYWRSDRPDSWQIAIRAAVGLLASRLPAGWLVVSATNVVRLVPGSGWIDTWRLEHEAPHRFRPAWLAVGQAFKDVNDIPIVDAAADLVTHLIPAGPHHVGFAEHVVSEVRSAQRSILLGSVEQHEQLLTQAREPEQTDTLVVGDRGLKLRLGPYRIAFPRLRTELGRNLHDDVDAASIAVAWRVVADELKAVVGSGRRRLVVSNTHELDDASRSLTALLVERSLLDDFAIVLCASAHNTSPSWLIFVQRLRTAGCQILNLESAETS